MNQSPQYTPSVEEIRHSLCSQLIGAGLKTAADIVDTAKAIEEYVFGAKPEMQNARTGAGQSTKSKEVKEASVGSDPTPETKAIEQKAVEETQTETAQYSFDDVKAALMRVAKRDREALKGILDQLGAANVPAIAESSYPQAMKLVEEFEAQNA